MGRYRAEIMGMGLALALTVGCGTGSGSGSGTSGGSSAGGGGSSSPPTTLITKLNPADQASAKDMLVTLNDLTTGWSVDPQKTNHDSTCRSGDAGIVKTADQESRFQDAQGNALYSQALMYESPDMTRQIFDANTSQKAADCEAGIFETAARKGVDSSVTVGKAVAAQLHTDPLGDQAIAYQITIPVSSQGQSTSIVLDEIFFQSGRAIGYEVSLGEGGVDDQQADDLAALMAKRAPTA